MRTKDELKRDIEDVARQVGISEDAIDAILNCKPLPRHKRQEPRVIIGNRIWGSDLYAVLNQYDISNDDFREAVITGKLSAYDEDDGKEVEIIHSICNANWTKNPPGFRCEDLEFRDVFDYYYKGDDIKKFLRRWEEQKANPLPADQVPTLPTIQTSADKLIKLTPVQEDKYDAIEIAEEYIRKFKGPVPSIKEAVNIVKLKLNGQKPYTEKTIRKWIKDSFKDERSHKRGRPKKEQ